tara:strand:- start:100 stop:303 length:204 start_codon:yes stop_codon:yes gene_type:complete
MRKLLLILCATIIAKHSGFKQMQTRLVLPIGHTDRVRSAMFSSDNQLVLTTAGDNTARIWDIKRGKD